MKTSAPLMRTAWILIILFLSATMISSCRGPASSGKSEEDTGSAPVPEGKRILRIYSAFDPSESKDYFARYEQETGVHVQWVRMSSGTIFTRLMVEKDRPSMGLWFGGSSTDFIAAAEKGLLASYKPKIDFKLKSLAHDKDWRWTGISFGVIGFASNTNRLKRLGVNPPDSWAALLDPRLKGEISMAYPYTSGTAFTVLSSVLQMMGEEKGFKYFRSLDENVHHYTKSGSSCVTQVGLGEISVGIAFSHDILKKGPAKGYPVVLTFPRDGAGYEIAAVALVKNGPDREEGEKFIDWILSLDAQNIMKNWYRTPLNPKADLPDGAIPLDKVKLIPDDADWAGANKGRLIEKWRLLTSI